MKRKVEVMSVQLADSVGVYVVKRATLAHPDAAKQAEFLCLHCEAHSSLPWFEIKQDGFEHDHYQLVCHCHQCLQLSVYEFEVKHENETA